MGSENGIEPAVLGDWQLQDIYANMMESEETPWAVIPEFVEGCGPEFLNFADGDVDQSCEYAMYGKAQSNNDEGAAPMPNQAPMHNSPVQTLWSENGYQAQILDESSFIRARDSHQNRYPEQSDFPEHLGGEWGQHQYIRLLFNAMRNTENVIDTKAFVASFLRMCPNCAIEMACWDILLAARDVQRWGQLTASHHKYKIQIFDTFHNRMMAIIECCRGSKAFCKSMMEPSRIFRAAQNPYAEINGKKINSQLNIRKSGINKLGQVLIRAEGRVFDEETRQWVGPDRSLQEDVALVKIMNDTSETAPDFAPKTHPFKRKRNSNLDEGSRDVKDVKRLKLLSTKASKPKATVTQKSTGYRRKAVETSPTSPNRRNVDVPDFDDSIPPNSLYEEYRRRLCTLLGIKFDASTCPLLHELRLYAYCVNEDLTGPGNKPWRHDCLPYGWYGAGLAIADHLGTPKHEHFAQLPGFARLLPLAVSRGDLHADRKWSINIFQRTFNTNAAPLDQRACGLVENPFGVLDQDRMEKVCDAQPYSRGQGLRR